MKVTIEFNTEKKVEDKDRLHVRLQFETPEMEEAHKLAEKLGLSTADIVLVADRLAYMTFDSVIGGNERLGFKELLDTVEKQIEWEREQEKKDAKREG